MHRMFALQSEHLGHQRPECTSSHDIEKSWPSVHCHFSLARLFVYSVERSLPPRNSPRALATAMSIARTDPAARPVASASEPIAAGTRKGDQDKQRGQGFHEAADREQDQVRDEQEHEVFVNRGDHRGVLSGSIKSALPEVWELCYPCPRIKLLYVSPDRTVRQRNLAFIRGLT